jgi:nitroreductase
MEVVTLLMHRLAQSVGRRIGWPLCTLAYVFRDAWNYARYSGMFRLSWPAAQRDSRMLAACHVLEKGLAFPAPKRPYGKALAQFVCETMTNPKRAPGNSVAAIVRGVLAAYQDHHNALGHDLGVLSSSIAAIVASGPTAPAGTRELTLQDFHASEKDLNALIRMRKSVRHFAGAPRPEQIEQAVELALHSPSACNRQGWRVYWTHNPQHCAAISRLHSGSRGFGSDVPAWIAMAVDVATFQGPRERWAAYVDGGMFAMTLLLALTETGVASCPLNWSTSPQVDRKLHELLDITSSEVVVMLIAIGTPPETCEVPISTRRPITEILRTR